MRAHKSPKLSRRGWMALTAAILGVASVWGSSAARAVDEGTRAPEIGLRDVEGNPVRLADLRNKVVIVDFWASWCAPCREELPVLERLYNQYKDQGLVVVGVNIDNDEGNMQRFLRRTPLSFPVVFDGEHQVAERYAPPRMPSSYIIDKRGMIRHVHAGFRSGDAEAIEREIQALLR